VTAVLLTWGLGRFAVFETAKRERKDLDRDVVRSIEPGLPRHFPDAGAWILRREADNRVIAFDDRCTHLGCCPQWDAQRRVFRCPCHGSEFDAEGKALRGPATRPLVRLFFSPGKAAKLRLVEKQPTNAPVL